jgi:hypothetical protein
MDLAHILRMHISIFQDAHMLVSIENLIRLLFDPVACQTNIKSMRAFEYMYGGKNQQKVQL